MKADIWRLADNISTSTLKSSLICHYGSCCRINHRRAAGSSDDASCVTAAATLSCPAHQFKLLPSGQRNIIFPSAGLMDLCAHLFAVTLSKDKLFVCWLCFLFHLIVMCCFTVVFHVKKKSHHTKDDKRSLISLVFIAHNATEQKTLWFIQFIYGVTAL